MPLVCTTSGLGFQVRPGWILQNQNDLVLGSLDCRAIVIAGAAEDWRKHGQSAACSLVGAQGGRGGADGHACACTAGDAASCFAAAAGMAEHAAAARCGVEAAFRARLRGDHATAPGVRGPQQGRGDMVLALLCRQAQRRLFVIRALWPRQGAGRLMRLVLLLPLLLLLGLPHPLKLLLRKQLAKLGCAGRLQLACSWNAGIALPRHEVTPRVSLPTSIARRRSRRGCRFLLEGTAHIAPLPRVDAALTSVRPADAPL